MPELPAGNLSALDQEQAYMTEFAHVFASYYKKLLEDGVPEDLAGMACLNYQNQHLGQYEE